jgi:hypothetical protein
LSLLCHFRNSSISLIKVLHLFCYNSNPLCCFNNEKSVSTSIYGIGLEVLASEYLKILCLKTVKTTKTRTYDESKSFSKENV